MAIYPTLAPGQVRYLLAHSQSRVLVLANREQLDQLAQMRDELPELRRVLLLDGEASQAEGWSTTWDAYLRAGDAYGRIRPGQLLDRWQAVTPQDMASLIYTSGTTGLPKAAILTHRNLTWTGPFRLRGGPPDLLPPARSRAGAGRQPYAPAANGV